MSYAGFLRQLLATGRVQVGPLTPITDGERIEGDEILAAFEARWRLSLAHEAPAFDLNVARSAAILVYRACQFHVFRDLGTELINEHLNSASLSKDSARGHYNVDLTMRFLPDLIRLATLVSPNDPLVTHLRRWAREWPLSSVGVADVGDIDIGLFATDSCLMQLYVDRILARKDASRRNDEHVPQWIAVAIGAYSELEESAR